MTSSFFGLDMALRALQAQQMGIDVTSHNVANANTDGYSRQNVAIVTTDPFAMPGMNRPATAGQLGTGAIAKDVQRARDAFLDMQYRVELGGLKNAEARQDALEQVEVILDEPEGVGLASQFNEYYRLWNELASDPSDLPVRTALVHHSKTLVNGINRIAARLADIRTGLDRSVVADVAEVNDITAQILQLNVSIADVEVTGQSANDFRDRRDVLLDRLAGLVQVTTSENANGTIDVLMGAQVLVNGVTGTTDLVAVPNAGNGGFSDVTYGAGGPAATLGNARISGLIASRDTSVPSYRTELDTMVGNLIAATNTLHQGGFDLYGSAGLAFFTGTDAATINVNPTILNDASRVAASSMAGAAGNNEVVLGIARLRSSMSPPLAAGTPTSEVAYNTTIARLGTENRTARGEVQTQDALVGLLDRRRESFSGVSLDEEAVSLVRYQRAYEAAARVLTAYDEMLDKLINSTGVVGR